MIDSDKGSIFVGTLEIMFPVDGSVVLSKGFIILYTNTKCVSVTKQYLRLL